MVQWPEAAQTFPGNLILNALTLAAQSYDKMFSKWNNPLGFLLLK
jgi:hypothetical protein